ncbi:MAG: PD-(D/E)XK nuclease domain-containing protein, partial [Aeromonadales bacterium]|nr:PD-(D/E)XK nuclease domain-containing protein [Aeromonadales bacterium]
GFTPKETEDYLSAFGLSDYAETVRNHYDGYLFDGDEIYNPWDVSKFVEQSSKAIEQDRRDDVSADNFWVGSESSGTLAIKGYLGTLADEETQKLQDVCNGKEVEIDINDSMNYDSLSQHNAKDMWSLLLHTGYLTATRVVSGDRCVVRIPNLEIKECFDKSIMASFEETVRHGNSGARLARALLSGDCEEAVEICQDLLRSYVCLRAFAARSAPEIFYEAMLSTLLSACNGHEISNLQVEPEAGGGYADIAFTDYGGRIGVVIELKASRTEDGLSGAVKSALRQISERNYADKFMRSSRVRKVVAVGMAFCRKICDAGSQILKDGGQRRDLA